MKFLEAIATGRKIQRADSVEHHVFFAADTARYTLDEIMRTDWAVEPLTPLPCPFCGGTDLKVKTADGSALGVSCTKCLTWGPNSYGESVESTIERWNKAKR